MYVLQLTIPESIAQIVFSIITFLPRLIGAIIVLLLGWFIGRLAARLIAGLADRVELDKAVLSTPLGDILGGTEQRVSHAFGTLAAWIVYAVAILAAANVMALALLSEWVATAVSYAPAFVAGLAVIVLGFIVADFIGDAIMRTRAATQTSYTSAFAVGTRVFLYFTAVVIGLSTMGIDVAILFTIARAFAWGLAAAFAIGVGGAIAFGARDYVSANVEGWMGSARSVAQSPTGPMGSDDSPEGASAADD
ncbi:mechanosensitive ion channel family protein [Haloferax sp. DFSO60]|uniref:mechanosensitive ion channel family protein n=1 Tax=Haloferax sp. DFSO60 TaxID=3388652 RepID=UPI0039796E6E